MNNIAHVQRPLFGPWLAWDVLPDSIREHAVDVLAAICLEIAEASQIGEQAAVDLPNIEGTRPLHQQSSRMESDSYDAQHH